MISNSFANSIVHHTRLNVRYDLHIAKSFHNAYGKSGQIDAYILWRDLAFSLSMAYVESVLDFDVENLEQCDERTMRCNSVNHSTYYRFVLTSQKYSNGVLAPVLDSALLAGSGFLVHQGRALERETLEEYSRDILGAWESQRWSIQGLAGIS